MSVQGSRLDLIRFFALFEQQTGVFNIVTVGTFLFFAGPGIVYSARKRNRVHEYLLTSRIRCASTNSQSRR